MDNGQGKINLEEDDFDAIEQAVLETERGRWFLAEYAARNRRAETTTLLKSITRLEKVFADELYENKITTNLSDYQRLSSDLETLIDAITVPNEERNDPVEGLTRDIASNAFALAGLADKIRDQIDELKILGFPVEAVQSLNESAKNMIVLSARQNQLARKVEAISKILAFCRERLARASGSIENSNPQDVGELPSVASLNTLRDRAYASTEAE